MPLHNWSRVAPEIFHDFHLSWIVHLSRAINQCVADEGYYSLIEPIAAGLHKTVLDTEDFARIRSEIESEPDHPDPAKWANRIAVYRADGDLVRGFVEILTPGAVSSGVLWECFVQRTQDAISSEFFVAVADAFPQSRPARDSLRTGASNAVANIGRSAGVGKWLGVASFSGDGKSQLESMSVGAPLPDLTLFLAPGKCVNVALETAYLAAWNGLPKILQRMVEGADAN